MKVCNIKLKEMTVCSNKYK